MKLLILGAISFYVIIFRLLENDAATIRNRKDDIVKSAVTPEVVAGDEEPKSRYKRALMLNVVLWPNGKIIYAIDSSINDENHISRINIAAKALTDATCVEFIKRNGSNENRPYLRFYASFPGFSNCESELGFRNKTPQRIVLSPTNCYGDDHRYAGVAVHELMHTLGFYHEFQRPDRNAYFTRAIGQILPGKTFNLTMDFKSITNYEKDDRFDQRIPQQSPYPPPIGNVTNMGHLCAISAQDRTLIDRAYAEQCKLKDATKVNYTRAFMIPGTDCKSLLHIMTDEKMPNKKS